MDISIESRGYVSSELRQISLRLQEEGGTNLEITIMLYASSTQLSAFLGEFTNENITFLYNGLNSSHGYGWWGRYTYNGYVWILDVGHMWMLYPIRDLFSSMISKAKINPYNIPVRVAIMRGHKDYE